MEKFGVAPEKMIDAAGADRRFGRQRSRRARHRPEDAPPQLITEFGDLEGVLAAAPAMKPSKRRDMLIEHADKARLSRELVTLRDDAPLPLPLEALRRAPARPAKLAAWLDDAGLPQHHQPPRAGRRQPAAAPTAAGARAARVALRRSRAAHAPGAMPRRSPTRSGAGDYGPYATVTDDFGLRDRHCRRCVARLRPSRARGVRRARYRDRRAGCDARAAGRILAGHRAGPRLLRAAAPRRAWRNRCPLAEAIAVLAPLLTDPSVLKMLPERQVRHAWCCGRAGFPAGRRRSTTPC